MRRSTLHHQSIRAAPLGRPYLIEGKVDLLSESRPFDCEASPKPSLDSWFMRVPHTNWTQHNLVDERAGWVGSNPPFTTNQQRVPNGALFVYSPIEIDNWQRKREPVGALFLWLKSLTNRQLRKVTWPCDAWWRVDWTTEGRGPERPFPIHCPLFVRVDFAGVFRIGHSVSTIYPSLIYRLLNQE